MGTRTLWQATDSCTVGGGETISVETTFADVKYLTSITAVWSAGAAPTTNENFVVEINSGQGAAYDTIIASIDPADESAADILWEPTTPLKLSATDQIKVTYANTDDLAIGVIINMEPAI
jgi:hypothetical protein